MIVINKYVMNHNDLVKDNEDSKLGPILELVNSVYKLLFLFLKSKLSFMH
jgi:hypothetical protein